MHCSSSGRSVWAISQMQRTTGGDVHLSTQRFAEFNPQAGEVQQAASTLELDEKIHVAPGMIVPTRDRTEDVRAQNPVLTHRCFNFVAQGFK